MNACAISWCVALTNEQFCPHHEANQALRPRRRDDEDILEHARKEGYDEGCAEGGSSYNEYD